MSDARKTLLAGAVLIGVGSFMPWAQLTTVFGTISVNGLDGDGVITLVLACVLVLIALLYKGKPGKGYSAGALVIAILAAIVSLYDLLTMGGRLSEVESEYASASIGAGLFVCTLGSIMAGVGAAKVLPEVPPEPSAPEVESLSEETV